MSSLHMSIHVHAHARAHTHTHTHTHTLMWLLFQTPKCKYVMQIFWKFLKKVMIVILLMVLKVKF